jgi:hypothetical protein
MPAKNILVWTKLRSFRILQILAAIDYMLNYHEGNKLISIPRWVGFQKVLKTSNI